MPSNLYVHFPFCRRKCRYCALYSRTRATAEERAAYVAELASTVRGWCAEGAPPAFRTIYFGGGSPALCDLRPLLEALAPCRAADCEWTVELHPLDASRSVLDALRSGGVNRISMGVQSLDDAVLAAMDRGHTAEDAARAFARVRARFDNAGIDLIVGLPGPDGTRDRTPDLLPRLGDWGLAHCSAYSLQNERGLPDVPDDDTVLDRLRETARFLNALGLRRYEISNYARPGLECRHNLAVWRGEDYYGLGAGASGRLARRRTRNWGQSPGNWGQTHPAPSEETLDAAHDELERTIFRLRTLDGLDSSRHPEWRERLARFASEGLLARKGDIFRLTARGAEVCDSILVELV